MLHGGAALQAMAPLWVQHGTHATLLLHLLCLNPQPRPARRRLPGFFPGTFFLHSRGPNSLPLVLQIQLQPTFRNDPNIQNAHTTDLQAIQYFGLLGWRDGEGEEPITDERLDALLA